MHAQRIQVPLSSGNRRSRKAPTQKGDGLKLAGEGLKLAGEGLKITGSGWPDGWLKEHKRKQTERVLDALEKQGISRRDAWKMAISSSYPSGVTAMKGSGLMDFVKSIASWLFGARSSKGKDEAKAEPEIAATLRDCKDILAEHGITDMRSWRRWALKNHPDKGGESELFAEVSDCVDKHIKGSGIASKLMKLLKKANVKGLDRLFPGEMHAPQVTKEGLTVGNFIGPGTKIKERLKRGDEPVSGMDALARRHDIQYSLATDPQDIRRADEQMLALVDQVPDNKVNKAIAKAGLGAKYKAEKRTGVLFPTSAELRKNDPLDRLLLSELVKAEAAIKKRMGGKGLKLAGEGLSLAGGSVFDKLNRLAKKYGKIASDLGITPEMAKSSAIKASKAVADAMEKKGAPPAVIKAVRAGIKQAGGGFWDSLLSVVSVLPIPFVSDVARVVSIAKTAADTASGTHTPALSGAVTGLMDAVKAVPVVGQLAQAGKPLAEMVGFGIGANVDPAAAVKMAGDYIQDAVKSLPKEAHEKLGPELKELSSAAKLASTVGKEIKGSGYCSCGAAKAAQKK